MVIKNLQWTRSLGGPVMVLLVAACGSAGTSALPTATPSATATPNVAATPSPSAAAATLRPPPSGVAEGQTLHVDDPALKITIPATWQYLSNDEIKAQMEAVPASLMDKESRAAVMEKLASGRVRTAAQGPTPGGVFVGFTVTVEPDVATEAAAIDLVTQEIDQSSLIESMESGTFEEEIGKGTWLRFLVGVPPQDPDRPVEYIPAQAMIYVVLLEDERALIIQSTGTQTDSTFRDLIDWIVSTIRRS